MDYRTILQDKLRVSPYYNQCSDCHSRNPTWCSMTYYVFLCTRCATLHKQLLNKDPYVSRIKSITLDHWPPDELETFCHDRNPIINTQLYCSTNNTFDLQDLINRKYIQPMLLNSRKNTIGPARISGRRRAQDYELSKFATQIRQIQNQSSTFFTIDNIVEALLVSRGNIALAYDLLQDFNNNSSSSSSGNSSNIHSRKDNVSPPKLPKRPSNEIKPAIFDGTNIISSQYINNNNNNNNYNSTSINGPRPAIFDGTVDLTQPNVYQQGMVQPAINQMPTMLTQPYHQSIPQSLPMNYIPNTTSSSTPTTTTQQQYVYPSNYMIPQYYPMQQQ